MATIEYTKTTWEDGVTVIGANVMNNIENGVKACADAINAGGTVGPAGPAGADATVNVGTVTTGDAGTQATVTNSGTASAAVFDFVIPRGADGAQGPKGDTGLTGPAGAKGDKGDTGATGPAGAKGDKGDTGVAGADGADGVSVSAIELTADAAGKITGGTATMSDGTTLNITITTTTV